MEVAGKVERTDPRTVVILSYALCVAPNSGASAKSLAGNYGGDADDR